MWSRILRNKLIVPQLVKEFPAFYENRKFIIVFILVRHLFIFGTVLIQSMPVILLPEDSF
jgi:hypothetical protein